MSFFMRLYSYYLRILCKGEHMFCLKETSFVKGKTVKVYECMKCYKLIGFAE